MAYTARTLEIAAKLRRGASTADISREYSIKPGRVWNIANAHGVKVRREVEVAPVGIAKVSDRCAHVAHEPTIRVPACVVRYLKWKPGSAVTIKVVKGKLVIERVV